jgi:hypothetical protein
MQLVDAATNSRFVLEDLLFFFPSPPKWVPNDPKVLLTRNVRDFLRVAPQASKFANLNVS